MEASGSLVPPPTTTVDARDVIFACNDRSTETRRREFSVIKPGFLANQGITAQGNFQKIMQVLEPKSKYT